MDQKHTKLGVAAFLLSFTAALITFGLIAIVVIVRALDHNGNHDWHAAKVLLALCLFVLIAMNLVALALAVAGLAQAERKKVFAVLALVLAALQLAGSLLLLIANSH